MLSKWSTTEPRPSIHLSFLKLLPVFACAGLKLWRAVGFFSLCYVIAFYLKAQTQRNQEDFLATITKIFHRCFTLESPKDREENKFNAYIMPMSHANAIRMSGVCVSGSTGWEPAPWNDHVELHLVLRELPRLLHYWFSREYEGNSFSVSSLWLNFFPWINEVLSL